MIKTEFKFEVWKWLKSNHIHRELHKHIKFHDKFNLEGQGQGH